VPERIRDCWARYEAKEYYLSELVLAADIFLNVLNLVKPKLVKRKGSVRGRVVLGTVEGDIHDMGKNLVAILLVLRIMLSVLKKLRCQTKNYVPLI